MLENGDSKWKDKWQKLAQHVAALLLFLFLFFWPGLLAFETPQNWYVPLLRSEGIVDGGLLLVLMMEMIVIVLLVVIVVILTKNDALFPRPSAPLDTSTTTTQI
jgi:glycerol uptake facilitator-like aquaporin